MKRNTKKFLNWLKAKPERCCMTNIELAKAYHASRTTISSYLEELENEGLISVNHVRTIVHRKKITLKNES